MTTYKIATDIRKEIAEAVVTQSEPGYDTNYFGQTYAVDTDGDNTLDTIYFKESNAPWNPWHDNAVAFRVQDLYADSSASFDPTPDDDFCADEEESGELNEEEIGDIAFQAAVDLALSELPTEFEPIED